MSSKSFSTDYQKHSQFKVILNNSLLMTIYEDYDIYYFTTQIDTYLAFMLRCTLSNKRCMEYQAILGRVMFSLECPVSNALNEHIL